MNKKLEQYLLEHSSPEDPVLEDLFRQTHLRFVNPNMVTGHLQGKLLEFISRMVNPEMILEIGTYTGYSAICLAKGLKPGGKLFTIEINDELSEFSSSFFKRAGFENKIVQVTGKAQDVIPGIDRMFDLVYIDGDKREYTEYYNIIIRKINPGGFIIVDNILWGEKVLENNTRDPQTLGIIEFNEMIMNRDDIEKVILPVRDGIMMIRRKA
ncbi:MAG: O-methyltransferase [Bacteroidales bacterium]|jgi:predicted O-methyltransferase YrrM|nr:O-methyltransferase [Bacteroidales bacterium]